MRDYTVVFIEPVELEAVAQAAAEAFAIPRESIELWNGQTFIAPVAEPVLAQVAAGSGPGASAEFVAFEPFAEHTGRTDPVAIAIELATRTRKRVIVAPEAAEEYRWTLVAPDGTHGQVVLDSDELDEGAFSVLGAVEPIPGAPDLAPVPDRSE
ncbi:hypothetical protein GCM10009830_01480 [Glycomyces endophyticus]|uniref:Uncharacterized protein n=1 Tax=Glycomyces endophyticus TaxID=480996 RepID=A0ABN2FUY2_9ACTN